MARTAVSTRHAIQSAAPPAQGRKLRNAPTILATYGSAALSAKETEWEEF